MATFLTEVTSRAHSHNSHSTFHPSEGPTISRFRSHAHPHPRTTPRPGLERVQETATVASGCENKEVESEQVFVREEGSEVSEGLPVVWNPAATLSPQSRRPSAISRTLNLGLGYRLEGVPVKFLPSTPHLHTRISPPTSSQPPLVDPATQSRGQLLAEEEESVLSATQSRSLCDLEDSGYHSHTTYNTTSQLMIPVSLDVAKPHCSKSSQTHHPTGGRMDTEESESEYRIPEDALYSAGQEQRGDSSESELEPEDAPDGLEPGKVNSEESSAIEETSTSVFNSAEIAALALPDSGRQTRFMKAWNMFDTERRGKIKPEDFQEFVQAYEKFAWDSNDPLFSDSVRKMSSKYANDLDTEYGDLSMEKVQDILKLAAAESKFMSVFKSFVYDDSGLVKVKDLPQLLQCLRDQAGVKALSNETLRQINEYAKKEELQDRYLNPDEVKNMLMRASGRSIIDQLRDSIIYDDEFATTDKELEEEGDHEGDEEYEERQEGQEGSVLRGRQIRRRTTPLHHTVQSPWIEISIAGEATGVTTPGQFEAISPQDELMPPNNSRDFLGRPLAPRHPSSSSTPARGRTSLQATGMQPIRISPTEPRTPSPQRPRRRSPQRPRFPPWQTEDSSNLLSPPVAHSTPVRNRGVSWSPGFRNSAGFGSRLSNADPFVAQLETVSESQDQVDNPSPSYLRWRVLRDNLDDSELEELLHAKDESVDLRRQVSQLSQQVELSKISRLSSSSSGYEDFRMQLADMEKKWRIENAKVKRLKRDLDRAEEDYRSSIEQVELLEQRLERVLASNEKLRKDVKDAHENTKWVQNACNKAEERYREKESETANAKAQLKFAKVEVEMLRVENTELKEVSKELEETLAEQQEELKDLALRNEDLRMENSKLEADLAKGKNEGAEEMATLADELIGFASEDSADVGLMGSMNEEGEDESNEQSLLQVYEEDERLARKLYSHINAGKMHAFITDEVEGRKMELAALSKELDDVKKEKEDVEEELHVVNERLTAQTNDLEELKQGKTNAEMQVVELEARVERLDDNKTQLEDDIKALESKLAQKVRDVQERESKIEELEKEVTEVSQARDEAKDRNGELAKDLIERDTAISTLEDEKKQRDQRSEESSLEITQLRSQVNNLENTLLDKGSELDQYKENISNLQKTIESFEALQESNSASVEGMQSDLQDAQNRITSLQEQVDKLHLDKEQKLTQIFDLEQQKIQLEKAVANIQENKAQTESELGKLKDHLSHVEERRGELAGERNDLVDIVKELEQARKRQEKTIEELNAKIIELERNEKQAEIENAALREKVGDLEKDVEGKIEEIKGKQQEFDRLKQAREDLEVKIKTLAESKKNSHARIVILEGENTQLASTISALKSDVETKIERDRVTRVSDELRDELSRHRLEAQESKNHEVELENQVAKLQETALKQSTQLEGEKMALSTTIIQLRNQIKGLQASNLSLKGKVGELQARINDLEGETEESLSKIKAFEDPALNMEKATAQEDLEKVLAPQNIKDEDSQISSNLEEKTQELNEASENLANIRNQLDEANSIILNHEGRLEELQRLYQDSESKVNDLQKELEQDRLEHNNTVTVLKNEHRKTREELEKKREDLKREINRAETAERNLEEARLAIVEHERQVDELDKVIKEQNKGLESVQREIEKEIEGREIMKQSLDKEEQEIRKREEEIWVEKAKVEDLKLELFETTKHLGGTKQEIKEKTVTVTQLEGKVQELQGLQEQLRQGVTARTELVRPQMKQDTNIAALRQKADELQVSSERLDEAKSNSITLQGEIDEPKERLYGTNTALDQIKGLDNRLNIVGAAGKQGNSPKKRGKSEHSSSQVPGGLQASTQKGEEAVKGKTVLEVQKEKEKAEDPCKQRLDELRGRLELEHDELKEQLEKSKNQVKELEHQIKELEDQIKVKNNINKATDEKLREANNKIEELKSQQSHLKAREEEAVKAKKKIEAQSKLEKERDEAECKERFDNMKEDLERKHSELQEKLDKMIGVAEKSKNELEDRTKELTAKDNDNKATDEKLREANNKIGELTSQQSHLKAREEEAVKAKKKLEAQSKAEKERGEAEYKKELDKLNEVLTELTALQTAAENERVQLKGDLEKKSKALGELSRQIEKKDDQLFDADLRNNETTQSLEKMKAIHQGEVSELKQAHKQQIAQLERAIDQAMRADSEGTVNKYKLEIADKADQLNDLMKNLREEIYELKATQADRDNTISGLMDMGRRYKNRFLESQTRVRELEQARRHEPGGVILGASNDEIVRALKALAPRELMKLDPVRWPVTPYDSVTVTVFIIWPALELARYLIVTIPLLQALYESRLAQLRKLQEPQAPPQPQVNAPARLSKLKRLESSILAAIDPSKRCRSPNAFFRAGCWLMAYFALILVIAREVAAVAEVEAIKFKWAEANGPFIRGWFATRRGGLQPGGSHAGGWLGWGVGGGGGGGECLDIYYEEAYLWTMLRMWWEDWSGFDRHWVPG